MWYYIAYKKKGLYFLEIFLMIKYALSYMLVGVLDYALPSQIDRDFIKDMFREFNAEKTNQDPIETSEIVNIDRLKAIYLNENLYKKIETYINRYQCRKIKLNRSGIFNLYFDGLSERTCVLYNPVTSGLLYGDYDIDELHYTSIFNELPYGSEDIIDAVSRLNQDDLVNFFRIYKLGSNNLFRKNKLAARDLSIHSKLLSFIDNSIKERNGALKENSKEQVDSILNILSDYDRMVLFLKYGFDLEKPYQRYWNSSLSNFMQDSLIPRMKRLLEQMYKGRKRNILTLTEIFTDYSLLEIVLAASQLPNDCFLLLKKRYGDNLNAFFSKSLSTLEQNKLDHVVLPRLGRLLKTLRYDDGRSKIKTVYDYFQDKKKSIVDEAIGLLDERDKFILFIRCGMNLSNPTPQEEYLKDATYYLSAFTSVIRKIGFRISIIENPESVNNVGAAAKAKKMYLRMKNK